MKLIEPHLIIGSPRTPPEFYLDSVAEHRRNWPAIMIPSGGTSGGLRYTINTWVKLEAAALAFQKHLGGGPINNCCVLPFWHVSGLMQAVRSVATGGDLVIGDYSKIEGGNLPDLPADSYIISLVPTQLRRLISNPETCRWLARMKAILVGGSSASEDLLSACRDEGLNIAPCYGLTESAALVTVLDPVDFLNGVNGVGKPLPGADVFIRSDAGLPVDPLQRGRIIVNSDALFHGYYPKVSHSVSDGFATDDEGYKDAEGNLHIIGRLDRIIITGGEKVDPTVVENAIADTGLVSDVVVFGKRDLEWGRAVSAAVVPCGSGSGVDAETLKTAVSAALAPYEIPKDWIILERIPRNGLGKIDWQDDLFGND